MTAGLVPDRQVGLADGRTVGFCIYGDPAGLPVLFLHGTPGSRFQLSIAHEACKKLKVALVAPDRWGYGLSGAPGHPVLGAYADDMAALMTQLGHARFRVGGVSGGAPYAAAVAAGLPGRVQAVALVSPMGPIADAQLGPLLSWGHRFNFAFLPRHPRIVSTAFRVFRRSLIRTPRLAAQLLTLRAARIDRQLMGRPEIAGRLLDSFLEGLRLGIAGPGLDLAIFARSWGVDLARVSAPARVWIGTADRDVPMAAVRALAARLPHCVMTELPGEGHLWVTTQHAQVIEWLVAAGGSSSRARG